MTPKWAKISVEVMCMYVNHEPKLIKAFELLLARESITKLQREILISYVTREAMFDTLDLQEFEEVLDKLEIKERKITMEKIRNGFLMKHLELSAS